MSTWSSVRTIAEGRLGIDHRVPRDDRVEAGEDRLGSGRRRSARARGRTGCPAALAPRPGRRAPPDPVRDLDELGDLREPRGERDVVAADAARPAVPIPLLVGVAERRPERRPGARAARRARRPSRRGGRSSRSCPSSPTLRTRARGGSGGVEGSPPRASGASQPRLRGRGTRARTWSTSQRCRRRTISPARARRCGNRR